MTQAANGQAPVPKKEPPAKAPSKMLLSNVSTGRQERPLRIIMYGTSGVGKSSWPRKGIYIEKEDGTSNLDVARFPEPATWADVLEAIRVLTDEEHPYESVVIDTLDWMEPLCWQAVCARAGVTSVEDMPYGKGFSAALDEWRILLARLERLRAVKKMHVIMLAHAWIKPFKNPAGDDFDRYEMKLHAKAAGLLKEWADVVLFATFETHTHKNKQQQVKGIDTGARIMHTQRRAAWDAKNRFDLPEVMPLDWEIFAEAVRAHKPGEPAFYRSRITELLSLASADVAAKVQASVVKAGDDAAELARVFDKLSGIIQTTESAQ